MNSSWCLILSSFLFFSCSDTPSIIDEQPDEKPLNQVMLADFETADSSPYFFRFGNMGSATEYDYKPRWVYSHVVKENPVSGRENGSLHVLEYISMEARNYGLKIRLAAPVPIQTVGGVRFKIYQPRNVLGRPVYQNGKSAIMQKISVKLLSSFNTINDFRQDNGVLLYNSIQNFTDEGKWITYTFRFSPSDYPNEVGLFNKAVVGIAIIPTYDSNVTLAEDSVYMCYIDDIVLLATTR